MEFQPKFNTLREDERIKKIRKRNFFILLIDLIIILGMFFYISNYAFFTASKKIGNLKLNFRYLKLKENIGYVFNLSIIPTENEVEFKLHNNGKVNFYIKQKKYNKIIWEKWTRPINEFSKSEKIFDENFNLKKNEILKFSVIYNNYEDGKLKEDDYYFGVRLNLDNNFIKLEIPVKIQNKIRAPLRVPY